MRSSRWLAVESWVGSWARGPILPRAVRGLGACLDWRRPLPRSIASCIPSIPCRPPGTASSRVVAGRIWCSSWCRRSNHPRHRWLGLCAVACAEVQSAAPRRHRTKVAGRRQGGSWRKREKRNSASERGAHRRQRRFWAVERKLRRREFEDGGPGDG